MSGWGCSLGALRGEDDLVGRFAKYYGSWVKSLGEHAILEN